MSRRSACPEFIEGKAGLCKLLQAQPSRTTVSPLARGESPPETGERRYYLIKLLIIINLRHG